MATLASLFNSKSQSIYSKFSNPNIPVEIKPDTAASRSRIKDDSRLLPVVSVQRDTSRISKFLKSNDGVLFIGKQLLLQTGNTFAETRLYNPLEALINVVPAPLGQHFPRHLGKPNPEIKNPTRTDRGALQKETLDSFTSPVGNVFARIGTQLLKAVTSPVQALLLGQKYTEYFDKNPLLEFYVRPEDNEKWYPRLLLNQSIAERGKKYISHTYEEDISNFFPRSVTPVNYKSQLKIYNDVLLPKINYYSRLSYRGEIINTYLSFITGKNTLSISRSKFATKNPNVNSLNLVLASAYTTHNVNGNTLQSTYTNFKRVFGALEAFNDGNGYFRGPVFSQELGNSNAENINIINDKPKISDPYNRGYYDFNRDYAADDTIANLYGNIEGNQEDKSDIIKFIFKTDATSAPIHFRALINTIKQNLKPEFNEQRYVGRTERFVTYAGAKRTVTLSFNIVAFSQRELRSMWTRVNYLTGLAFPKSASPSGFMVPPLFRITIGGIYDEQPCYIDNLDFDFLDDTITFDIDKEVSQVINVNMSLTLLEKRSRFYDSPFYAITQDIKNNTYLQPLDRLPPPRQSITTVAAAPTNDQFSRQIQQGLAVNAATRVRQGSNFQLFGGSGRSVLPAKIEPPYNDFSDPALNVVERLSSQARGLSESATVLESRFAKYVKEFYSNTSDTNAEGNIERVLDRITRPADAGTIYQNEQQRILDAQAVINNTIRGQSEDVDTNPFPIP
jgi:hypothetical protein